MVPVRRIVMVCAGNVCRSPAAATLLGVYLRGEVQTLSVGMAAAVGADIDAPMRALLEREGVPVELGDHEARQGTPTTLGSAHLIVAMSAKDRRMAVSTAPATLSHTFLLLEVADAARLGAPLNGDTVEARIDALPEAISSMRPELAQYSLRDVPDPIGQEPEEYERIYVLLRDAVQDVAAWLSGEPVTRTVAQPEDEPSNS